MPPPGTYIDIDTLPFSRTVTQAEFNGGTFGGTANAVWFRRVAAADEILGMYTNAGGTFAPITALYASDGTTLHKQVFNPTGWWRLLAAGTYYLRITRSPSGASDFDFTVTAEQGEILSDVPLGSVLINDDSVIDAGGPFAGDPFPSTVWTPNGTFLGFVIGLMAGELGDALPSGVSIVHSVDGGDPLTIYDTSYAVIDTPTVPGVSVGAPYPSIANDGTSFYVLERGGGTNNVYSVSAAGVVAGPLVTLAAGAINAIGVSRDGTILYWVYSGDDTIKRHSLTTGLPLSDLYTLTGYTSPEIAFTPNSFPGEILVLPDGTIVTSFDATEGAGIVHISAAGTLLDLHELSASTVVDHLHYDATSPSAYVLAWIYASATEAQIGRFNLSSGAISPSFNVPMFEEGVNLGDTSDIFGPSQSCFMFTVGFVEDDEDEIDPPPIDASTPCPCPGAPGGLDTVPNPIGDLPPWVAMCEGGCGVDSVADVAVGEVWL